MPYRRPRLRELFVVVGGNVKRLRKAKGMTQEQLIGLSGIDRGHMHRIETGQVNITLDLLLRLADALGTTPDELLRASS